MTPTDVLEGLALLLQERGIARYSATGASSIFLDYLPERVEHSLALTTYAAEAEAPGRRTTLPRVQIRARGDTRSPRWSRDTLGRVYAELHGFRGDLPNGVTVANCYGLQSAPMALGPDAAGRYEHAVNFQLWTCDSPVPMEARHGINADSRPA